MGNTIFITGASSGFGKLLAAELASKGDTVIAACRNHERGQELVDYYNKTYKDGKGGIEILACDLGSFESVSKACALVRASHTQIDSIIHNAGIWNFHFRETVDGIEETLQVNLLSALLITHQLIDLLTLSPDARLIFTASGLHQGKINFQNIEFRKRFVGYKCYRQSKLGVILITRLLARNFNNHDIGVYCLHPGMIRTNLARDANWFIQQMFKLFTKPVEEGNNTLRYLLETPKKNLRSGEYYSEKHITRITAESYDLTMASRLLEASRNYLKPWLEHESILFP